MTPKRTRIIALILVGVLVFGTKNKKKAVYIMNVTLIQEKPDLELCNLPCPSAVMALTPGL